MKLLDYDIDGGTHRSAKDEWAPHKAAAPDFFEWHYFTAPMTGANGHQYFLFLCSFNFSGDGYKAMMANGKPMQLPEGVIPYMNTTHICDYTSGLFKEDHAPVFTTSEAAFHEEQNALILQDNRSGYDIKMSYQGDTLHVYAKTAIYECDLHCTGASQVMWMQDTLGKEGFIREGAEQDRSFYFSLPRLPFNGWIKYTEADGSEKLVEVTGQGWVDRQWGNFFTKSWEWTSFRFADGDRVNTYNFASGHQVCTLQKPTGETASYPNFTVVQNGYLRTPAKSWVSWGWDYTIPVKEGHYKLVPLSDKNIIGNHMNTFFEGLSRILNDQGEQVGWAVTESMDVREMHNAPYDIHNTFPEAD